VGANTNDVTDATWTSDVLQADRPVLVDFWAEWCGPCRKVAPVLEEIAESELGEKVRIVKLNIDENPNTARDYGIMSIPTLTVFKGGEPVQSVLGVQPKGKIVEMIQNAL
jgi:thioredoxin 1